MAFSTKAPTVRAPAAQRSAPVAAIPRSVKNVAASIMLAAPLILNSAAIAEPQGPSSVPAPAQEAAKALGMEQQLNQKAGASKAEFLGLSSGSGAAEKSNQAVKATLSGADIGEFNAGLAPPGPSPSDVLGDGRDLGKDAQDTVKRTIQGLEEKAPKVDLSKTPKVSLGDLGEFNAGLAPPGPSPSDVLGDGRDLGKDAQNTIKRTVKELEKSAPNVDLSSTPKLELPNVNLPNVNTPNLPSGGEVKRNLLGAVREADAKTPDLPSGGEVKRNLLGAVKDADVNTPNLPSGGEVKRNLLGAAAEVDAKTSLPSAGEVKRNIADALPNNPFTNQVDQAVNNTGNKVKSDVDTAQAVADNSIFDALNPFSGEAKKAVEAPETKVKADLANVKENSKNVPGEAKKAVNDPKGKVDSDLKKASKEVAKLPQFQDKMPGPSVSEMMGDGRDLGQDAQDTVKRTAADVKSSADKIAADAKAAAPKKSFGLF